MKYVVIGGGIAGTTAAETLRKLDKEAEITLIGEEAHVLYSRVLLPHYVEGKVPREKVFLKQPTWYKEQQIEYQAGVRMKKIDSKNKFVATSEGREFSYDKLLITTGGEVNLLPEDRRGVSYFRTIDDADQLVSLLNEVKTLPKEERQVAIYGGGFISLEYINMFAKAGFETTVFMRSDGFWSKILSPASQSVIRRHVEAQGVQVETGVASFSLEGEAELEALHLQDGRKIPARILGVGIGIHADRHVLEEAGISLGAGVRVNEYLETNLADVYAAGDIAEFFDAVIGRHHVAGNWMNAVMQARTVAHTMTGDRKAFSLVSSYATDVLGKHIVFIGDTSREHADEVIQHIEEDEHAVELFERDNRTVGAVLVGSVEKRQAITNAIKAKERYDD